MNKYPKCPVCEIGNMVPGFTSGPACDQGEECQPPVSSVYLFGEELTGFEDTDTYMFMSPGTCSRPCGKCNGTGVKYIQHQAFRCPWCRGYGKV